MSDFRDNYIKAREIIAIELKKKYNLIESYRENDRLTLDSSTHSIHLTFYVPDGDEVSISEKGKEPGYGQTFMGYFFDKYPKIEDIEQNLKKIFTTPVKKGIDQYSVTSQYTYFKDKINFLEHEHPQLFQLIV